MIPGLFIKCKHERSDITDKARGLYNLLYDPFWLLEHVYIRLILTYTQDIVFVEANWRKVPV